LITSIKNRRPSIPTFNPGTAAASAGTLAKLRINWRPSIAVLLALPSRSLVSAGRNLDRTLALTDWNFDIARVCGKSEGRSDRFIVRKDLAYGDIFCPHDK